MPEFDRDALLEFADVSTRTEAVEIDNTIITESAMTRATPRSSARSTRARRHAGRCRFTLTVSAFQHASSSPQRVTFVPGR
jgi:hypothetical protein